MMFGLSTGNQNLGNNDFVGLADVSNTETDVIVPLVMSGTFTAIACRIGGTAPVQQTYTVRISGINSGLACTIPASSLVGSGTGFEPFTSSDFVSIQTPSAQVPGKPAVFMLRIQP